MDKFGIFKLLNSFLNFNAQKETSSQPDTFNKNSDTTDLFSKLLSSLNKNDGEKNAPIKEPADKSTKKSSPPLQTNMLKTMTSHEEFIKRVKQKNT